MASQELKFAIEIFQQAALKARVKHEAKEKCRVMWVPCVCDQIKELASIKCKGGEIHVKCEGNHKDKPACDEISSRESKYEYELEHETSVKYKVDKTRIK